MSSCYSGDHIAGDHIHTGVTICNTEELQQKYCLGWMDDLRFYVLVNSISVISGKWEDDNERLCAMEPRLRLNKSSPLSGLNSRPLDQ